MPKFSAIIPTYNRASFVCRAVESILAQTFTDFELIVVDDGSTDATEQILEPYKDRIIYIRQNNSGVSAARNRGIDAATGEWLAFLDSDDEWHTDYLARHVYYISRNAPLCMQVADALFLSPGSGPETYFEINGAREDLVDADYMLIERPFAFIVRHGPWQIGAAIFRRDAVTAAGCFDATITLSEDLDFMARVALRGAAGIVNKVLVDIFRREETTECLTKQAEHNPLHGRRLNEIVFKKLCALEGLRDKERRVARGILSANKRAIGNLLMDKGDIAGARSYYGQALSLDPSTRSIGKYLLSYLSAGKRTS